jgi:hypothetical protein
VNDVSFKKNCQLPTPVYFQATTVTEVRNLPDIGRIFASSGRFICCQVQRTVSIACIFSERIKQINYVRKYHKNCIFQRDASFHLSTGSGFVRKKPDSDIILPVNGSGFKAYFTATRILDTIRFKLDSRHCL